MKLEQIILDILARETADLTDQLEKLGRKADQVIADLLRLSKETTTLEQGLEEIKVLALAVRSN